MILLKTGNVLVTDWCFIIIKDINLFNVNREEDMAFKKGVTVYFTDEGKYEEFLENHEKSGTTKSKFVLRHLEDNKNIFGKLNNCELMAGLYNSNPYVQCVDAFFSFPQPYLWWSY
jgi:hypothetical protein